MTLLRSASTVRPARAASSVPRSARGARVLPGHVLAWVYAAALLAPLYYLVVSSFKGNIEIFTAPFTFPSSWELDNFLSAWDRAQLGSGLVNSAVVAGSSAVLTLVLAIPASFSIARARGRTGAVLERMFSLGFLIPGFAALIPTVLLAIGMGLFHTRTFLVLFFPATALPLSVVLLTQFMKAIPSELEESATIDGATRMQVLRHVYLPLARPGIATVTILNLLNFWNEYLFTLVLGGPSPDVRTVQVALPGLITQTNTQYGVLAAGTLITLVPVYVAYVLLARRIEEALLQGAVKS